MAGVGRKNIPCAPIRCMPNKILSRTVRQGRAGKTFPVFLAVGDLGKKQRKFRE
jgi:hypothetical protein